MQKIRPDSKLKNLPSERQSEIAEYAREHALVETVEWLKANGVETSLGPLSTFLRWYRLQQQMDSNQLVVERLLADLTVSNPDLTPERAFELGQIFFAGLGLARQDPRAWHMIQSSGLSRGRLDLAKKKYQARKQAEEAARAPGGLTPETVKKIEHELHLR